MMKAEELAVLDKAIKALGNQSYLGPWLASVRAEVERDVQSDFCPEYLPSAATAMAKAILAEAEAEAERMGAEAERTAAFRVGMARDEVARIKGEVNKALKVAILNLGGDW